MNRLSSLALILPMLFGNARAEAGALRDLLTAALEHPRVEAQERSVASAEAALDAATGRYLGSGELSASVSRFEDRRIVGPFVPYDFMALPADRELTRYSARYRVPVDVSGLIAAGRERARSDLAAGRLAEREASLLALHRALTACADLHALNLEAVALAKRGASLNRTEERVRARADLGDATRLELSAVESERAAHDAANARLSSALQEARARLAAATGDANADAPDMLTVPPWPAPEAADPLPVRIARERDHAAAAAARERERALWPSIELVAEASHYDGGGASPNDWILGVQASVPIAWSAHRERAAAALSREATAAGMRAAERESTLQIRRLESAYRSATAEAAAAEHEIAYRREVVSLAEAQHALGELALEALLRPQRDLLAVEAHLARARADALSAWSALQILLGTPPGTYIDTATASP